MTSRTVASPVKPARRLRRVTRILSKTYGNPRHHNKDAPLDELVFILLSGKTTERSYLTTYSALERAFPGWWGMLEVGTDEVARVIRVGGLSQKKALQLQRLLRALEVRFGDRDVSALLKLHTADAESLLTSLPGVGLKSARCVLMYSLGRRVFPVDTHCRRVLSRLGFIESARLTDTVQDDIQATIPPEIRYSLHVNAVAHGRAVCRARAPLCDSCPISSFCEYYRELKPARRAVGLGSRVIARAGPA